MAMPHPDLLGAGPLAGLRPLLLPLGPPLLWSPKHQTAFPHLCAFAQAALLPPVNPDFSFMALHSAPSLHWLPQPWGGAYLVSKTLDVETLEA